MHKTLNAGPPVALATTWPEHPITLEHPSVQPQADEDDDDDDEAPHVPFDLMGCLAAEDRLAGSRMVAEVVASDGDSVGDYQVLGMGQTHAVTVQKQPHVLVTHQAHGVEVHLTADMQAHVVKHGAVRALEPGQTHALQHGDVAWICQGHRAYVVRVVPAPATLSEAARARLSEAVQDTLNRQLAMAAGGWSVGLHGALFMAVFVASLMSPKLQNHALPDTPPQEEFPDPQPMPTPSRVIDVSTGDPTPTPPKATPPQANAKGKTVTNSNGGTISGAPKLPNLPHTKAPNWLTTAAAGIQGPRQGPQLNYKTSGPVGVGLAGGLDISPTGARPKTLADYGRGGKGPGEMYRGIQDRFRVRRGIAIAPTHVTPTEGFLPREMIERVVQQHLGEISLCYEHELLSTPNVHGKLNVNWMIQPDGRVGFVGAKNSTLNSTAVASCVMNRVRTWVFPNPQGGRPVSVVYPFMFRAAL